MIDEFVVVIVGNDATFAIAGNLMDTIGRLHMASKVTSNADGLVQYLYPGVIEPGPYL